MLIRFTVENFLSFKDRAELSMIPGKGRVLKQHVIKNKKRDSLQALKSAVIYGANASGKSNLIKAMSFARNFICEGRELSHKTSVKPFKLDSTCLKKPSRFEFEIGMDKKTYAYGFIVDFERIKEEWLYEIDKKKDKCLFERKWTEVDSKKESSFTFGSIHFSSKKDEQFLKFIAKGTRGNELFLREMQDRNVDFFDEAIDVFNWFLRKLAIIFPTSKYGGLEFRAKSEEAFFEDVSSLLSSFDTGISKLSTKTVEIEQIEGLPKEVLEKVTTMSGKDGVLLFRSPFSSPVYSIWRDKTGELKATKLITKHKVFDTKKDVSFELFEESDGTRRMIDLIPILLAAENEGKVFVIDELDRSFHPEMTRYFLELFFSKTEQNSSQIIVTTHESSILDLKLLRKDEIWFAEKNQRGESHLYSLEEYKPRYDKNIRTGYLAGRFGGIPLLKKINRSRRTSSKNRSFS